MPDSLPQPLPAVEVAARGFTSTGGFVYRAVETTGHAGRIPCLFVSDDVDAVHDEPHAEENFVRLEIEEAAEIGLWLLRLVGEHLPDPHVRSAVRVSLDRASRMIGEGLAP